MAKCNFSIPFNNAADSLLDKARSAIEKQGGIFNGDQSSGNFSVQLMGTIAGNYQISGQQMLVEIMEKPMFISCSQIESFMRGQFGK
ncbi:MAG: hypothetical protein ABI151_12595 [Chitinophagaceae bacterium]